MLESCGVWGVWGLGFIPLNKTTTAQNTPRAATQGVSHRPVRLAHAARALVAMPSLLNQPSVWTPRSTRKWFHPTSPPTWKRKNYSPPREAVPIKGAFAGLSPKLLRRMRPEGSVVVSIDSADLLIRAEALETFKPVMSIEDQISDALAGVDIGALSKSWDPTQSGCVLFSEFRLRVKGLLAQEGEPSADNVRALFNAYDVDRSGVIDLSELSLMLQELRAVGKPRADAREAARQLRQTEAAHLRQLAARVDQAKALASQADAREAALQQLRQEFACDVEAQLGMAFARRRVKPTDFVGQFATDARGMSSLDFCKMTQSLIASLNASELSVVFASIDHDGSGYLDLSEAAGAVGSMQQRGADKMRATEALARRAENARKRADAQGRSVLLAFSSSSDPSAAGRSPGSSLNESPSDKNERGHQLSQLSDITDASTAMREKQRRLRRVARGAAKRILSVQISMGWNAWMEFVEFRRALMQTMRLALLQLLLREFARAFATWLDFYDESLHMRQMLSDSCLKLRASELTRAFRRWTDACPVVVLPALGAAIDLPPPPSPSQVHVTEGQGLCQAVQACIAKVAGGK